RTATRTERRIIKVRLARRWGPARIAYFLGLNPATVHRVLTRYRLPRLAHLDRGTGRVIRRYEHPHPGDLVHVDIKKLGNIPDGGGHRVLGRDTGRRIGQRHRTLTPGKTRDRNGNSHVGYSYLHNAVDDHSRLAYSEILADETRETAVAFWTRAQRFFTSHGITVARVLTDNGSCYKSHLWRDTLTAAAITHKRTRPYRPQTNGKEHRTVQPHPARRMGLRTALSLRDRTPRSLPTLAPHLQSPPRPHRTRRQTTRQPHPQPLGTEHLVGPGA
ncbi:MAG: hypothetical protein QOC83_4000, partial [Pseudonocardiales bacterium]|nr:hypothetical protein [Pseudonocardiales bacterium]